MDSQWTYLYVHACICTAVCIYDIFPVYPAPRLAPSKSFPHWLFQFSYFTSLFCFICCVEFPFWRCAFFFVLSVPHTIHYLLPLPIHCPCPPPPICDICIPWLPLLLSCFRCGPKRICWQLAVLPRQSKAQIFKLLNGTLIMRSVRVPAQRVTPTLIHSLSATLIHLAIPFPPLFFSRFN